MFYVYILKLNNNKNKNFYIGFAPDLNERLIKHFKGLVKSTKDFRPLGLVYYEAYASKRDALIREKRLKKHAKGFAMLKGRIKSSSLTPLPLLKDEGLI